MKLLFLGDVMGRSGRKAVIEHLPKLREDWSLDFVVINAENSAAGYGMTAKIADSLFDFLVCRVAQTECQLGFYLVTNFVVPGAL